MSCRILRYLHVRISSDIFHEKIVLLRKSVFVGLSPRMFDMAIIELSIDTLNIIKHYPEIMSFKAILSFDLLDTFCQYSHKKWGNAKKYYQHYFRKNVFIVYYPACKIDKNENNYFLKACYQYAFLSIFLYLSIFT